MSVRVKLHDADLLTIPAGETVTFTVDHFNLKDVDKRPSLYVSIVVANVSGNTTAVTVTRRNSNDGVHWQTISPFTSAVADGAVYTGFDTAIFYQQRIEIVNAAVTDAIISAVLVHRAA